MTLKKKNAPIKITTIFEGNCIAENLKNRHSSLKTCYTKLGTFDCGIHTAFIRVVVNAEISDIVRLWLLKV